MPPSLYSFLSTLISPFFSSSPSPGMHLLLTPLRYGCAGMIWHSTSFAFVLLSLSSPLLMLPLQPALSRQRLLSPSLSSILLLPCLRGLNLLLASPTAACLCSQVGVLVALIAPVCCGARALMFCSSQLHTPSRSIPVVPLYTIVRLPLSRSSYPMHLQLSFSFRKEKRTREKACPCIEAAFKVSSAPDASFPVACFRVQV